MKIILLLSTFMFALSVQADTGMEENSKPEKVNYLYKPLNHLRTQAFVGPNYFDISGDLDFDANPGFNIGVQAEAGQHFAFLVGVKYMKLRSEGGIPGTTIEITSDLDYLSLLLGAKYYFAGSNSGFYVRGNLDPSLLISSSDNSGDDFKDFNLFASIGGGFVFPGAAQFVIDLSYNQGLLDISKSNQDDSTTQGLQLNFGLLF